MSIDVAHLFNVISSERFLKKQGLGNELPFFICPYDPGKAVEAGKRIGILKKMLAGAGVAVLEINLYDLCLDILKEDDQLEELIAIEAATPKAETLDYLRAALSPERHLAPAIRARIAAEPHDVLFVTGVGEVFPYIRSHTVLNNLQSVADDKPLILFFPGEYAYSPETGSSLDLFGRLHNDKYYRAFNISHFQP